MFKAVVIIISTVTRQLAGSKLENQSHPPMRGMNEEVDGILSETMKTRMDIERSVVIPKGIS